MSRESFQSRLGFLLVSAGCAIGIGNVWRFPYVTGAYGGGVFAKTGGYWVNGKARRLSPRECARLMGYPDSYLMADNKNEAYKQFGNSVTIPVIEEMAQFILRCLEILQEAQ